MNFKNNVGMLLLGIWLIVSGVAALVPEYLSYCVNRSTSLFNCGSYPADALTNSVVVPPYPNAPIHTMNSLFFEFFLLFSIIKYYASS
jgi:hypothetical protein